MVALSRLTTSNYLNYTIFSPDLLFHPRFIHLLRLIFLYTIKPSCFPPHNLANFKSYFHYFIQLCTIFIVLKEQFFGSLFFNYLENNSSKIFAKRKCFDGCPLDFDDSQVQNIVICFVIKQILRC